MPTKDKIATLADILEETGPSYEGYELSPEEASLLVREWAKKIVRDAVYGSPYGFAVGTLGKIIEALDSAE